MGDAHSSAPTVAPFRLCHRLVWALLTMAVLCAGCLWAARASGEYLRVDEPAASDVIVVLADGPTDLRYFKALQLSRSGLGDLVLVNASTTFVKYGRSDAERSQRFIEETAADLTPRVHVCPLQATSTAAEARFVGRCLEPTGARRILLVTDAHRTRRARAIFRTLLPQYQWSVAAVDNPGVYGIRWWQRREWAEIYLLEWEKTFWWYAVDHWLALGLNSTEPLEHPGR